MVSIGNNEINALPLSCAGITCPIVPGVLVPPPSLPQTLAVYAHSHATPPPALLAALEAASGPSQEGGEEAVRAAGAKHTLVRLGFRDWGSGSRVTPEV